MYPKEDSYRSNSGDVSPPKPIDVDFLLSAVQEKTRKIAEYEKAMGFDHPR
jgi:hypothetical protein